METYCQKIDLSHSTSRTRIGVWLGSEYIVVVVQPWLGPWGCAVMANSLHCVAHGPVACRHRALQADLPCRAAGCFRGFAGTTDASCAR